MTFILGLTGGIGSGKTAASQWFEQQGIFVVDSDIVAREIVQQGEIALQEIHQHFGDWVLTEQGELNRPALRQYIFEHPDAKKALEHITHPRIRQRMIAQLAQQTHCPYHILVSPLLFETEQHRLVQRTLLIDVDEHLQLQRACARDTQSQAQIQKIIQTQFSRQQKRQLADDIVINDGTLDDLYQQLAVCHQQYLQLAQTLA
ncbi:MAG: dephospho-CoA kinase [Acinetobacter sp.]|nr:dephospho-CoA kinase [Acinetobacter sp.]